MISSDWLDIAIGLVFVWFVLAIVVSAANEGMNRLLAVRSKQLWHSLGHLLDGTPPSQPLLGSATLGGLVRVVQHQRPQDPDAQSSEVERLYATQTIQALEPRQEAKQKTRIAHIPPVVFSQALIELGLHTPEGGDRTMDEYLAQIPNVALKRQLRALWQSAHGDLADFGGRVESWFDGQMARVSATYKSKVRLVLLAFAAVVAVGGFTVGLRSDSLALVSDLQHDSNLRTALASAGSGAAGTNLVNQGCPTPADVTKNGEATCQLLGVAAIKDFDLAIGDAPARGASWSNRLGHLWPFTHWRTFLGVLLTAVAISFGSTFWYDILRRLVGLRGKE